MSKPTKFTPGNKGDIYTDSETGIKYECLGPLGFTDAVKRNPPEYQWDEAHPSKYGGGTGGGAFVVNVTTEDGSTYTADKTFEEIANAIDLGKYVHVSFIMGTQTQYYPLTAKSQTQIIFSVMQYSATGKMMVWLSVTVKSDNTVTSEMNTISVAE